ncbi:MAG: peptidoglycan DD-metalloendopeptidase family protein [Bacteroidales bacterium]
MRNYRINIIMVVVVAFSLLSMDVAANNNRKSSIKREQADAQKAISETSKKISSNQAKTSRTLKDLELVTAEIKAQNKTLKDLSAQLDSINRETNRVNDSIRIEQKKLEELKAKYANAIKKMGAHSGSYDKIMFLFSASSFKEAYRRMRYLQEFTAWRKEQSEMIMESKAQLERQGEHLKNLSDSKRLNLVLASNAKSKLESQKKLQDNAVNKLKKESKQLKTILAENERKSKELDKELERIIAEEQRLAEERARKERERLLAEEKARKEREELAKKGEKVKDEPKKEEKPKKRDVEDVDFKLTISDDELTKKFEKSKGKLLFPVSGTYRIVRQFGKHKHPQLKYVETNNSGIDIETAHGADARAVCDGKVSAIFRQEGFNTVVMVRHGSYLSIYVNLGDIYVNSGQHVKVGQKIGKIFSDPDDGNRTTLHFEIRKEKDKLNPEQWVK